MWFSYPIQAWSTSKLLTNNFELIARCTLWKCFHVAPWRERFQHGSAHTHTIPCKYCPRRASHFEWPLKCALFVVTASTYPSPAREPKRKVCNCSQSKRLEYIEKVLYVTDQRKGAGLDQCKWFFISNKLKFSNYVSLICILCIVLSSQVQCW